VAALEPLRRTCGSATPHPRRGRRPGRRVPVFRGRPGRPPRVGEEDPRVVRSEGRDGHRPRVSGSLARAGRARWQSGHHEAARSRSGRGDGAEPAARDLRGGAEAVVDEKPGDVAKFGLSPPAATIKIQLRDGKTVPAARGRQLDPDRLQTPTPGAATRPPSS
jgi:hypothetical protein